MIRLGLRLTLGSGREAALRVLVTAAAVTLGVGLLLAALAGVNGLHAQTDRAAWLDTSAQASSSTSTSGQLWWLASTDQFANQAIDRVDVAVAGPNAPVPPGIPHVPGPGEYYASPALTTLNKSEPANELRDRYPGRQIGTIGAAALPSPNSLIIVVGHAAPQLSRVPGAVKVGAIQRTLANCYACQNPIGSGPVLQWVLAGGAVFLLLPVLILIATASRLSAVRREQRFAAMRLVGATPRQISVVSGVEAVIAALAGVAVGFALFFVFRALLYHVPFTGAPFAGGDLSLQWIDVALAVIGMPVAAVVSARLALRRVQISPLGVNRRASSHPPRIVRIIPLLSGIAVLAYFDAHGKPGSNGGQLLELLVGFVLLVVGLVLAGPWFTTAGSRLMVKRASRPAALLAGRRLLDNPKAAFRFISGLVIALFVASALIGALSSISAFTNAGGGSAGKDTLAEPFCSFSTSNCPASAQVPSVPGQVLAELHVMPGVRGVAVVHESPSQVALRNSFGVVACDLLRRQRTAEAAFATWGAANRRANEFTWLGGAFEIEPLLLGSNRLVFTPGDPLFDAVHKMYGTARLNPYERELLYGFPYVVGRIGTHKIRGPLLTAAVEIVAEGARLEIRIADDVLRFNSLPFRSEDDSAAHDKALARILEATPALPLTTAELTQFVEVVRRELPNLRIDAVLDGRLGPPPSEPRSAEPLRLIDQAALFLAPKVNYFLRSDLAGVSGLAL